LLGGAALGFLTMVGLWLDFNRTAASLAYVIVLKNRAKKAGLLTRLGCHSFRATGITSICSTAASSSTLSRSAAPLSVPRHVGRRESNAVYSPGGADLKLGLPLPDGAI